jgi:TonB family protein
VAPVEKEPPAESAAPAAEAAAPRSIDGISFGTGTGGGVPGIGSAAFPYDYYRSALRSILQSHWRRPVTPEGLAETVTCEVRFAILRTGIIQDIQIVHPSGNAILDQSALRAVYDSNPLPPLPAQYGQSTVMADVVFELTPE